MKIRRSILLLIGLQLLGCGESSTDSSKYWADSMGVKVFARIDGSCVSGGYFTGERTVWYKSRRSSFEIVVSNEKIKDGLRHGLVREEARGLIYLSNYLSGKRNGEFIVLGEKNQLLTQAYFRQGILSGTLSEWYNNGVLHKKAELANGLLHGKMQTWWPNGRISTMENFSKGIRYGEQWAWDEDGKVIIQEKVGTNSVLVRRWTYHDEEISVSTETISKKCDDYKFSLHTPKMLKRVKCDNFWKIETIDYFSFLAPPYWENESECKYSQQYGRALEMFRIEN